MKKRNFIILLPLLLFCLKGFSQYEVIITHKNGDTISDKVTSKYHRLFSTTMDLEYDFNKIKSIKIKRGSIFETLYIIPAKTFKDSKSQFAFGTKLYDNDCIELYHLNFRCDLKDEFLHPKTYNYKLRWETYIKKKDDHFAYHMSAKVDGLGYVNLKKRLGAFFSDCPNFMKIKRKNRIKDKELIKLADLYKELCMEIN